MGKFARSVRLHLCPSFRCNHRRWKVCPEISGYVKRGTDGPRLRPVLVIDPVRPQTACGIAFSGSRCIPFSRSRFSSNTDLALLRYGLQHAAVFIAATWL